MKTSLRTSIGIAFTLCFTGSGIAQTPAKLDPPVTPSVSGKFAGNGKPAAIKYVIVEEREEFGDEPAIRLVFSEIDPSNSKKPSFDAMFNKLGSALSISVDHSGKIFGCEVGHSAHEKRGFSAIGEIKMAEFKIAGGNVTGHVTTNGERDAFGEKWDVDLTFAAPLPEKLRNAPAAPPKKEVAEESDDEKPKEAKMPAGPAISAHDLPIPLDATDVDIKKIVGQIQFSSPQPVAAVTKEMSTSLKQQGWKNGAGNLEGKTNSILKREQGDASLTIMIQPAPSGSVVKIFTEGLDWTGVEDAASTKPTTPKATDKTVQDLENAADAIEANAQKLLNDALKNLPK